MKKRYLIGMVVGGVIIIACVIGAILYFKSDNCSNQGGVWPVKYDYYLTANKDNLYEINDEMTLTQEQVDYIRSLGISDTSIKNAPTSMLKELLSNSDGYQNFSVNQDNITSGFLHEKESSAEVSREEICKIAKEELENADFSNNGFQYCNAYTVLYDKEEGIWCVKYKRIPTAKDEERVYETYCAYINKYGKTVFLQYIDPEV